MARTSTGLPLRPCGREGCTGSFRPANHRPLRRFCSSRCGLLATKASRCIAINAKGVAGLPRSPSPKLVKIALRIALSVAARLKGRDPVLVLLRGLASLELDEGRAVMAARWKAGADGRAPALLPEAEL